MVGIFCVSFKKFKLNTQINRCEFHDKIYPANKSMQFNLKN